MAAASYNLFIEQGATWRVNLQYHYKTGQKDTAGNDITAPYDITGCKLRMQIRQRRGGDVLISATTTNGGIVITDALTGRFTITITDEATDTLTVSRGKYDLEIGFPSGDVARIMQGSVTIDANITQDADRDNIGTGLIGPYDFDEQDVDLDTLVRDQPSTA